MVVIFLFETSRGNAFPLTLFVKSLGISDDGDQYHEGMMINDYPWLGNKYWIVDHKDEVVCTCCIGNPKIKKWQEKWLVHAKTTEEANTIVQKEYEGTIAYWRIANVKETQILGVLDN